MREDLMEPVCLSFIVQALTFSVHEAIEQGFAV
jgi:hypothetical protein